MKIQRKRRHRGMTLVELMIAAAVGAILSAAALQLFSSLVKYSRQTAMTTELNDRVRMAREIITHDLLSAGYYWRKEAVTGATAADVSDVANLQVSTGSFDVAGMKANMLASWPRVPVSGVDNGAADKTDIVYLIVPNGGIVGANFDTGHASYKCKIDTEGGSMTLTSSANTNPEFANMGGNKVIVGTSFGFIFLSTLTANVNAAGAFTVNDLGSGAPAGLPVVPVYANECEVAGRANLATLPSRLLVYPVDGVAWMAHQGDLRRCTGTEATTGPKSFSAGCNATHTVLAGFDDLQIRYRFLQSTVDGSDTVTAASECTSNDPATLTNPHLAITECGTNRKRRTADPGVAPMVRFVGFEVGVVGRSLKPDHKEYSNRGKRPALFNRVAGGADSYRRAKHTWKVSAPNFYIF